MASWNRIAHPKCFSVTQWRHLCSPIWVQFTLLQKINTATVFHSHQFSPHSNRPLGVNYGSSWPKLQRWLLIFISGVIWPLWFKSLAWTTPWMICWFSWARVRMEEFLVQNSWVGEANCILGRTWLTSLTADLMREWSAKKTVWKNENTIMVRRLLVFPSNRFPRWWFKSERGVLIADMYIFNYSIRNGP